MSQNSYVYHITITLFFTCFVAQVVTAQNKLWKEATLKVSESSKESVEEKYWSSKNKESITVTY